MDFDLSKPQKLLQDSVREFLSRECPAKRVRELMESATAFDQELWAGLADQGWTGLTIPEKWEGLGLSAVDLAAVSEMMGQACLPGPFVSNVWGSALLSASGNEVHASRYLEKIVDGDLRATVAYLDEKADWEPASIASSAEPSADGYVLNDVKLFVGDAETADVILWVGCIGTEIAIFTLDRDTPGITVTAMPAVDLTRKIHKVELSGVNVTADRLLVRGAPADAALRSATREATVAVCAEMVGAMQWMLNTTVEYVKTREQFGKVVGSYQAVAHRCADMFFYLESARSAAYTAAWAVSVDDPNADRTTSVAKAYCSDAIREVGNNAIQAHGGIGFTWEYDLQLYYKRGKSDELLFGDATYHRERIARMVIDA
ncbi:MAG: acyl-CoA dehydrogenase [bacterium]|nr:acyl-CoA dehydrogenase [bacterium]